MFAYCSNLTNISALSSWNTSSATTMERMFKECSNLIILDMSGWDTSNVTNVSDFLYNNSKLVT